MLDFYSRVSYYGDITMNILSKIMFGMAAFMMVVGLISLAGVCDSKRSVIYDYSGQDRLKVSTKIDITRDMILYVEEIPGVVSVGSVEKYSFRVQKGRMFKWKEIKPHIERILENNKIVNERSVY